MKEFGPRSWGGGVRIWRPHLDPPTNLLGRLCKKEVLPQVVPLKNPSLVCVFENAALFLTHMCCVYVFKIQQNIPQISLILIQKFSSEFTTILIYSYRLS